MAQILAFPARRAGGRGPSRHGAPGEVVLFCGVRVEYHDGEEAADGCAAPDGRRPPWRGGSPRAVSILMEPPKPL
jgi:hypothetical protein